MLLASIGQGFGVGRAITGFTTAAQAAASPKRIANSITITNKSGAAISNYPFQFGRPFVDGAIANEPQVLINGQPAVTQADVKNRYPDGSVEFAVIAVVIPTLPATGSSILTFQNQTASNNTPLTQAQMLDPGYNFDPVMTLSPLSGPNQRTSGRSMLQNGDYKLWTSGPVAQTIMLADDTTARKYDIGFGDGYHPFRPRFYATFWPATHQVFVRAIGENGLSTEIEDLAYKLNLTSSGKAIYSADLSGKLVTRPKLHWAGSRWTRKFWIGGTPSPQVNIDNNLAYLESTRFLPNFDTSITVAPSTVAQEYAFYAQNANDIYDGSWNQPTNSTTWQTAMPSTGARQDIAPYPEWTALWLYTGDWRMRQVALGLADQAASWAMHIRETDPTKRLLITDPKRVAGERLRFAVLTRRPPERLRTIDGGRQRPVQLGHGGDNLKAVSASVDKNDPWGWDGAHQPQAFFPQYILTGDPFYLEEMEFWASITAFNCWGGTNNMGQGCGPYPSTTVYAGAIHDQLRGDAWTSRNRAETAFAEPDVSPMKAYFTALMNEAIARWEGGFQLTGTKFDGTPEKVWGAKVGNDATVNAGPFSGQVPPMHNWESICSPTVAFANCIADPSWLVPAVAGSFGQPWMQWYLQYSLGRLYELGYPIQTVAAWSAPYPIGMINDSGMPTAVALYNSSPLQRGTAGWFTTWAGWLSAINFSGCCGTAGFQGYFNGNLASDGRQVWLTPGLAMLVDEAQPGAVKAWSWWIGNVYSKVPDFANDPKWAIVPRTDTNVLPAQPL